MHETTSGTAGAAVVRPLPIAPNRTNLTLREIADAYLAGYKGRDPGRPGAVAFWTDALGDKRMGDITADDVADVLHRYASTLYLLVLMALTTGARKGELLGLRYRDLDLARCTAHLRATKNGCGRVSDPGAAQSFG